MLDTRSSPRRSTDCLSKVKSPDDWSWIYTILRGISNLVHVRSKRNSENSRIDYSENMEPESKFKGELAIYDHTIDLVTRIQHCRLITYAFVSDQVTKTTTSVCCVAMGVFISSKNSTTCLQRGWPVYQVLLIVSDLMTGKIWYTTSKGVKGGNQIAYQSKEQNFCDFSPKKNSLQ